MKDSKVVKFLLASVTEYSPFVSISGGVEAAMFLVRMLQWSPVLQWCGHYGEWFSSTTEEISVSTKLTSGEQELARKTLQSRGLLVEEIRDGSGELWFKVEVDKVIEALEQDLASETSEQYLETSKAS